MTGQFAAPRGDTIVIKERGALYWSPPMKTAEQPTFVGIAEPDKRDAQRVRVLRPSASPCRDPSVKFSADYSHATVDWDFYPGYAEAAASRSTDYERVRTK
jgi:hypothetical protein